MVQRIIIVDDDALLRRSLAFILEQAGYQVFTASNAEDSFILAQSEQPDLILLDIGLPGMDGLEAIRYFEKRFDIPIVFISARRRELDEILGLELGADDYITKPFDADVLLARVKAVLRRKRSENISPNQENSLKVGDLMIEKKTHTVRIGEKLIGLSPLEFKLLFAFASDPGKIFSADDLLTRVWGAEYVGQPQVVYVHLRGLRKKIEKDPNKPQRIVTVRGVGYKFNSMEI